MLDTASFGAIGGAARGLLVFADSAETSIRLARAARSRATPADSAEARQWFAAALASRGHLAEAYELIDTRAEAHFLDRLLFVELVRSGAVAATVADSIFGYGLANPAWSRFASSWWAANGDTASISRVITLLGSLIASDTLPRARVNSLAYDTKVAAAFLSLARRDTVEALRRLTALPMVAGNGGFPWARLTRAQLLVALGRDSDAAEVLDQNLRSPGLWPLVSEVLWKLERARVNERLGNAERAIPDYSYVVDVWRNADDILQPFVSEAREALQRLTGELPR